MYSMPKIEKFVSFNVGFTLAGYFYYLVFLQHSYVLLYFFTLLKNIGLLYLIHTFTKKHLPIKGINELIVETKDVYNLCLVSSVDVISIYLCKKNSYDSLFLEFVLFIPHSFAFEIIFDFFHYVSHRMAHTKYLYSYIHKKHHEYRDDTNILTTFHQDLPDLVMTNLIPMYFTSLMLPFSYRPFFVFLIHWLLDNTVHKKGNFSKF